MSRSLALVVPVVALLGCSSGSTAAADGHAPPTQHAPGVLATVNGKRITSADVRLASQAPPGAHGQAEPAPAAADRNVLETIIRDELIAQRAEALQLDRQTEYQTELATRQAQLETFRRARLAELYEQHVRRSTTVTDDDARRYFEANAARLRSEVHVWQILVREESRIQGAQHALAAGTSFDEVARSLYPAMPAGETPWDLGFLRWNMVPESWRSVVYAMSPGETSDVIRGPRNRFWIIRLVARREAPSVTFESSRPTLLQLLREERLQSTRATAGQELRRGARVQYVRTPRPE